MSETKWKPTDEQRRVLTALKAESEKEVSVAQFCRDYAPFTESKFSKIMNAIDPDAGKSYFDEIKDREGLMEDLEDWLKKLPRLRYEHEQAKENPIYKLSPFRAVATSIRECKNKLTPERITKYIAPTGASKTSLRHFLMHEFRNELAPAYVECRESWRPTSRDNRNRAKHTAILDICAALKMRLDEDVVYGGLAAIEDALTEYCTETKRLLFFDEGEFFSSYVLNLVKMLLNKTRLVVVIACTPRAHVKWNMYYADEADQIARRTHAVIKIAKVSVDDAGMFFPENQFASTEKSLEYIATQASHFGHFSLVARVATILRRSTKAERSEVENAVKKALVQMGREKWESPFSVKEAA